MASTTAADRLRNRLNDRNTPPFEIVGVSSALVANRLQRAGFEGGWLSGLELSTTSGTTDTNTLTLTEVASLALSITSTSNLLLVVDADNGFGSTDNAIRAARLFTQAGVAGMCIEDKVFPKRNSFLDDGHQLESAEDFCERISAIHRASDGQLLVCARTEALIAGLGLNQALERMHAYKAAGADLLLCHSKDATGQEIKDVAAAWTETTPLVCVPTACPHLGREALDTMGYRLIVYANHLLRASIASIDRALEAIASGEVLEAERGAITMADLLSINGSFGLAKSEPSTPSDDARS